MAAFLVFFAVVHLRNRQGWRFSTPVRDNGFVSSWLSEHKLKRCISVLQTDRITSPIAVGLIKPRIILPKSMDMDDTGLLSHVLMHEYCHIKRFDALWKILLVCAVSIHWFNPLVWVMFILANRDLELTCDEMVIRHFGEETKTAYAYSIIGMAELRSSFASLYNGFSRNAAVERIESIMKMKRKSIVSLFVAVIVVTSLTIGAMSVFAANGDRQQTSEYIPLPPGSVMIRGADGTLRPNEYDEVLRGLPRGGFNFENSEELSQWLAERQGMPLPPGTFILPRNVTDGNGMRIFESFDALREYFGDDFTMEFATDWADSVTLQRFLDGELIIPPTLPDGFNGIMLHPNAENFSLPEWAEGMFTLEDIMNLPSDSLRLVPANTEGLRSFESLDALLEYFGYEGEAPVFMLANTPILPHVYGMDELFIYILGEKIDLLADPEIYAMIQDGATMEQVMAVLLAR
jgi:hypothetical protein